MSLKVPRVYNNTKSLGYRKDQTQKIKGTLKIIYKEDELRPTFEITNNTVNVINGKYAVYVQYSQNSVVYENCLYTDYYCGDAAVFDPGDIWIYGNYCPNCNCVNCNCTH